MKTNRGFLGDEERANRVREHYWKRDEKYRRGPSSEDVWVARKEMVRPDSEEGCFNEDLEALEKAEMEEMMKAKMKREKMAESLKAIGMQSSYGGKNWSGSDGGQ